MASGGSLRLGGVIEMDEKLIQKACFYATESQKSPEKPFIQEKFPVSSSHTVIFSFPAGSWSVDDWVAKNPVGETEVKAELFGSVIRSIGTDEIAMVNKAFQQRFENKILGSSDFRKKVEMAVKAKKQIVFTGHSVGGAMAIFATLWFLKNYSIPKKSPHCLTFGCPLIGNHIVSHALRRENWASCFKHFVMRYDIVPRIMLAPISSIQQKISPILQFFSARSKGSAHQPPPASDFFKTVMENASALASHTACNLMANTNLLSETLTSFIKFSPYRPFGTYIFCSGNRKLVVLTNPDAVLQLLFYSSQLSSETEVEDIACNSLKQHFEYLDELQDLHMKDVYDVNSNQLETIPLSAEEVVGNSTALNSALTDLGLSTRARRCLRSARELEKQKQRNKAHIIAKQRDMEEAMKKLEDYREKSAIRRVGWYDAFKLQETFDDFIANVKRLELAGIWDEIMEMLKRCELPDGFESEKEWIELGTSYRRLVEPLDIANFYRHLKNEDAGAYMERGRPKRYRYTQKWREHDLKLVPGASGESHFWAEVEELCSKTRSREEFERERDRVLQLERDVRKWANEKDLGGDVFLEKSTLVKWWKALPEEHRRESCLSEFIK
ncbi:protein EDS1L-like [Juglans microcarpa x Juglans regia]|uniref:protein EDS1L-like n=1 Tax=Juglans microcarpa x Juglans regia TaxID=2249226 RepID=UPI001B7EF85E|nr:protein EDS1L-like [Juglans microcarpa x Juglans regia]